MSERQTNRKEGREKGGNTNEIKQNVIKAGTKIGKEDAELCLDAFVVLEHRLNTMKDRSLFHRQNASIRVRCLRLQRGRKLFRSKATERERERDRERERERERKRSEIRTRPTISET